MAIISEDMLVTVLRYLNPLMLLKMRLVSKKMRLLVEEKSFREYKAFNMIYKDESKDLPYAENIRISYNRMNGIHDLSDVIKYDIPKSLGQRPCMQNVNGNLYVASRRKIQLYEPRKKGQTWKPTKSYKHAKNVTKFVTRDRIVSGCLDGTIYVSDIERENIINLQGVNQKRPKFLDYHGSVVVSTSGDADVKIFRLQTDDDERVTGFNSKICRFETGSAVRSLSLSKCGSRFACGLAVPDHGNGGALITLVDLNREKVWCFGRGRDVVLDMQFKTEEKLVTCGKTVQLWDIRCGGSQCSLKYSFKSSYGPMKYNCVKTDGYWNVFAGSQNGIVNHWDTRFTNDPIQTLELGRGILTVIGPDFRKRKEDSPIFSLGFDCKGIYAALAQNIKIIDYSVPTLNTNQKSCQKTICLI